MKRERSGLLSLCRPRWTDNLLAKRRRAAYRYRFRTVGRCRTARRIYHTDWSLLIHIAPISGRDHGHPRELAAGPATRLDICAYRPIVEVPEPSESEWLLSPYRRVREVLPTAAR